MNLQEFHQLQAERGALIKMLDQLPVSSVISRMSLEARKRKVEEELASQPDPPRDPVHATLTFSGKPIVGSHGMFAEFGATAVKSFADAVSAIGAGQIRPLGTRGVLPNRDDYQLLITGTALGSFGFELEEAPKNLDQDNMVLFAEASPVESAIEQVIEIMIASLGTDDELTEAIYDADPRGIDGLRAFLKTMVDQDAVCALEFKDEVFRFSDVGQVCRSEMRLRHENIQEEEVVFAGTFLGLLPIHREFEFLVSDSKEVISGKVGSGIEDADTINQLLKKPLKVKVHSRTVGNSRPRYILLDIDDSSTLLE